jgi:hypothetical protein
MKKIEITNLSLPNNYDLGFDNSVQIPHFGVNRAINYSWGNTTLNEYDLDALCNIALYSQSTSTPNFVQYSPLTSCFLDDLAVSVTKLNEQYFNFELWGINSGIQFLFFDENRSAPDWQCILKPGKSSEKLVAIMGISNPSAASGGECEILDNGRPIKFEYIRGRIYVFPAWTHFRFAPVEFGTRLFLSFTVFGSSFK